MRSIAIVNQKGGCGKTTTAVNLASCFAELGQRVLLIDCDPQSHASLGVGIDTEKLDSSTYDLLMEPKVVIRDVARPVTDGLHAVPSNVVLSAVEQQLAGRPDRENRLREKIEQGGDAYDFILIDCPPSVGLLTFNALVACREVLVVTEPSHYSLHGAVKMIDTVRLVREQLGMRKRLRLLVTLFDRRTRYNRDFLEEARTRFGPGLLETVVRRSTRFKESARMGVPVGRYDRSCGGADDYLKLAEEIRAQEASLEIDDFEMVAGIKDRGPAPETVEWILAHPGPQMLGRHVLFSLAAPDAKHVELVGSFNQWCRDQSIHLKSKGAGLWAATVDLSPGRHLYKFIVDGVWIPDPRNENRTHPNADCILEVPGSGSFQAFEWRTESNSSSEGQE